MLESIFGLRANNTSLRQEMTAGLTTFITMGYIVFVNPSILAEAGMNFNGVLFATCVAAALGCFVMGFLANYPFALAPGMGINAYFTYAVVLGMGHSWQTALGAVLISGLLFIFLTLIRAREVIVRAIPESIRIGTALGIGLFISFIGFKNAGIVVDHPATLVGLGNMLDTGVLVSVLGLLVTGILVARRIRGGILIGILSATLLAVFTGLAQRPESLIGLPQSADIAAVAFEFDLMAALKLGFLEIVFVFLFVDMFDTIGSVLGLSRQAGYTSDTQRELPRINRVLMADSVASTAGAMLGTSTVTTYIESASGISEGGRTGLTAVTVGVLFLLALVFTPIVGIVPAQATAPALIIVGAYMLRNATALDYDDMSETIPAFLTMITMPLSFSIATGLAFGFISYPIIKVLSGRAREVSAITWVLAALFLARFIFLAE